MLCPPEGDAGTGMVATCSVAPRTGNVSAGTSIFAMVVLERPLEQRRTTSSTSSRRPPATRSRWCTATTARASSPRGRACSAGSPRPPGTPLDADAVFEALFREALDGEADAGGLLAYNHLAGEPIAGLAEGRPLFVRTPDSRFTLANFMRAQLYGVFGTLSLGMRVLDDEGVALDRMFAPRRHLPHRRRRAAIPRRRARRARGGRRDRVRGRGVGHRRARVLPLRGIRSRPRREYLRERVFAGAASSTPSSPHPDDVAGFAAYLDRYRAGLAVEAAAVEASDPASSTHATLPFMSRFLR